MTGQAPVGVSAGEYEITGLLGRGGMGAVYAGVHPVIGTEVAIKVLDPRLAVSSEALARFVQEARVVNKIRHPNIIEIFAFGESPDLGHYFVMPHLRGQTLDHRIAALGPMPIGQALPILRQIAEALDAAHDAGVCHRDLKPENVFLVAERGRPDTVKILDFGLAKLTDGLSVAVTQGRQLMGTPLYMSPQQWAGEGVDHRTDIYALGVMLHHMVTGRHPFEGETAVGLMRMHTMEAPALPSQHGGPAFLDPIVRQALAKDDSARHQRAGLLHDEVAAAFAAVSRAPTMEPAPASAAAASPIGSMASTGAMAAEARRAHRVRALRALLLAAAAAGLIAGGAAVVVAGDDGGEGGAPTAPLTGTARPPAPAFAPSPARAPVPAAAPAPAPRTVRLRIDTRPSGAMVALDGQPLGTTPVDTKVSIRASGALVVELTGHRARSLVVPLSSDLQRVIELVRLPRLPRTGPGREPRRARESKWGETENPF